MWLYISFFFHWICLCSKVFDDGLKIEWQQQQQHQREDLKYVYRMTTVDRTPWFRSTQKSFAYTVYMIGGSASLECVCIFFFF